MKKFYLTIIFLILLSGVIVSQIFADNSKAQAKYIEPALFKADTVRIADIGLHNAAGDLFWLAAIQYFGGGESQTNERMSDYLNLTSDLNPKFPYPYAFGALVLPGIGQTDQAIALAQKGIEDADPDWRIPYYIATTYYFGKNDQENALKYFDLAAHTKGAPDNIQKIAANFATRGGKRQKSEQIWTGIYENSKDDTVRERAKAYLTHYEILDFLEEAAKQYYKVNNKYPSELNDLVTSRILKAIPPDPFGLEFKINASDGTISMK